MSPRSSARRGFTLAEILVALLIVGIIGAAMVRLILVQSRFTETQLARRNARTVSRNAMNIMLTDIRMVQDTGGLVAASSDSVTLRVPVAFGMLCNSSGSSAVLSLLPVDSAMLALASYGGWAYRDSTSGVYNYTQATAIKPVSNLTYTGQTTDCTDSVSGKPGILSVTYGTRATKIVQVDGAVVGVPNPGWPAFIYQNVTYKFGTSTTFPGRIGLYRRITSGGTQLSPTYTLDEIIAPFDPSAKFRFYVLNADTAQSAVPTNLRDVRGIQLVLTGSSPGTTRETGTTRSDPLVTGVFFKNRRDP